jgi:large subunit ribosomal protein L22
MIETKSKAYLPYIRVSPSKARIVLDLVRNKPVVEALAILKASPQKSALFIYKLIKSAVANASQKFNATESDLYVSECFADKAPTMKRIQPRAKGAAYPILKRSCHITVVVAPIVKEDK